MSISKSYISASMKCRFGPGGMNCTCCTHFNCHPRNFKPLMRRMRRRNEKQEFQRELRNED